MSSQDISAFAAEVAFLLNAHRIVNCCYISTAVFSLYDHLVTFDREHHCFWSGGRVSGASAIFFANRYINSVLSILQVCRFLETLSDKSCFGLQYAISISEALQLLPWALFSTLRVYALSKRYPLAALVLSLSLAPFGINFVHFGYRSVGYIDPLFGCAYADAMPEALTIHLLITSRVCLVVADLILVVTTWVALRMHVTSFQIKTFSFAGIILRDGSIYFITLVTLNALHLALSLASIFGTVGYVSDMTVFTNPITAILVSRFLLNLQEASQRTVKVPTDNPLHISEESWAVRSYARVIGPLGSSLHFPPDADDAVEV